MSIIPFELRHVLQFYLSGPMPCPYLPGRVERKLFTHLSGNAEDDGKINTTLTRAGFRRSHNVIYRPACEKCNACIPVRIPIYSFTPSRNLRRIAASNRDLRLEVVDTDVTDENYQLFMNYQAARHADGDMARMSREDFTHLLQKPLPEGKKGQPSTYLIQLRAPSGALVGCMISDHVGEGMSAVYSFFDPREARRSLGTQLILTLIEETRRNNLSYLYLGYWIADARKMAYKARFRPLEALGPEGWNEMKVPE